MTENPYQSPLSSEHSELSPQERRGLGGWAMVVIGSTTGALTIGISGAVGAALLFVVGGSSLVFAAAAIGGVFGFGGGALWGAVTGFWVSRLAVRMREQFVWSVAIGVGIYGAAVGCLGGTALRFSPQTADLVVGALIGGATGLGGGWLLGRRLASVCWDSSKTNSEGP